MPVIINDTMKDVLEEIASDMGLSYAEVVDMWELCEPSPEGLLVLRELLGYED